MLDTIVIFNGKTYAGPRPNRNGGSVMTSSRATALRLWKGKAVRAAETDHLATKRSIMAREYV